MAELAVNDVVELKKQLESLISDYTKVLNSTVSIHVEIYSNDKKGESDIDPKVQRFVDEHIDLRMTDDKTYVDEINKKLNGELSNKTFNGEDFIVESFIENGIVDGNSTYNLIGSFIKDTVYFEEDTLNYFNVLKFESDLKQNKYLCFIRFKGFDKSVLSVFKNYPMYSFLKFLMDGIFNLLNKRKYNVLDGQNRKDYIAAQGREFMNLIFSHISDGTQEEQKIKKLNNFFDEFNYISTLSYEGASVVANLLLTTENGINEYIDFYIKLKAPIYLNQHRKIRKLLEMSADDVFLIADHEKIYGLGQRNHNINQVVFIVEFIGEFEYKIKVIPSGEFTGSEREKKCTVLYVKYGTPNLKESNFSINQLKDRIEKTFYGTEEGEVNEIDSVVTMIEYAIKQRSGTTVVITTPDVAESEIEQLGYQGITIDKRNLVDNLGGETKKIIDCVTCIDGAVYLDYKGDCYAIGIILDGIAEKDQGDSARGARYNSAIRYANKENLKNKCLIVVISEDGMIDIIPDTKKEEENINRLENELIVLRNKGEFQKALQVINKMKDIDNRNPRLYFNEAEIYIKLQRHEDAIDKYSEAIKLDNEYGEAYIWRGYVYNKLGKYRSAVEDYNRAIELDEVYAVVYNNRGYAYQKLERYEEALVDYAKAIELDEEYVIVYENRGGLYIEIEGYENAIKDYTRVIELDKEYAIPYNDRGYAYEKLERYEEALVDYAKAIELNGEYAIPYNNRGYVYQKLGKYEEALEEYIKAIELNGKYAIAYKNRGGLYIKRSEYEKALEDYNRAIELGEEYAIVYNNRGYAYQRLEKYEEALEDYTKAIDLDRKYVIAYKNRGNVYKKLGEYEEALKDYKQVVELDDRYKEIVVN
ncbi:tetratricopeptide repeat protein [Bacillus wiedmannii]|uniref:tetratricopeptide repeat protein n=1 Tax=Bacillus wiedmannii TaxID=1890302 RepID=UPI0007DAE6E2|nr:tetratricopeptide repeat protein [Bacillus wiedmannii]MED2836788.1 tetratricopeptide repeat protein [Bacillus wiedmannii]OAK41915.1 hypothetical protein A6286_00395 [Bacillus wiedmannii]